MPLKKCVLKSEILPVIRFIGYSWGCGRNTGCIHRDRYKTHIILFFSLILMKDTRWNNIETLLA